MVWGAALAVPLRAAEEKTVHSYRFTHGQSLLTTPAAPEGPKRRPAPGSPASCLSSTSAPDGAAPASRPRLPPRAVRAAAAGQQRAPAHRRRTRRAGRREADWAQGPEPVLGWSAGENPPEVARGVDNSEVSGVRQISNTSPPAFAVRVANGNHLKEVSVWWSIPLRGGVSRAAGCAALAVYLPLPALCLVRLLFKLSPESATSRPTWLVKAFQVLAPDTVILKSLSVSKGGTGKMPSLCTGRSRQSGGSAWLRVFILSVYLDHYKWYSFKPTYEHFYWRREVFLCIF